jgi:hypothetical protein
MKVYYSTSSLGKAALYLRKESLVPTGEKFGWRPKPVWIRCKSIIHKKKKKY